MTLSMAWVRSVGRTKELVFASDSRLRGGEALDFCPKIFDLPRSDCLISFAGATAYAYPLITQMSQAIRFYPASNDRRTDIHIAKAIALDVFNQMRAAIHDFPVGQTAAGDPEVGFIFGGYSWREERFVVWKLHYDPSIDLLTFRPARPWGGGNQDKTFALAGDATDEARQRLVALLRERGKLAQGGLDMEPFEVLRDMIRQRTHPAIGGAPQVAKVYRYMRTQHFAVQWPSVGGRAHALGRPTLAYEQFDLPMLNPDAPHLHSRYVAAREHADAIGGSIGSAKVPSTAAPLLTGS